MRFFLKKKVLDWTQGKILAFLSLHSVNFTRLDHFIRQIPGQALIFCHAANYKQFKTAKLIFSSILINQTLFSTRFFPFMHYPFQISTASQPYFMERTCHVSNRVKNLTHNVENGWMHKFICLMDDDLVGKRGCFSINKIHLLTIISLHFFFIKKMLYI